MNNVDMFKELLFEFIEEFNERANMFKITYYEIYEDTYYLYVEDVETGIEYRSENNIDSFVNCKDKEDYKRIMLTILERDIESEDIK